MDVGQPRLKFVRQEDAVGVFKVPDLTPAAESEAREIRIAIDKTEFHLISGSALLQDDIYAITFGPLSGEILTAIKIVEETWIEGITIKDLLPVSGGRTDRAILVGDEDNKQLLINPQTLVAIEEAMPGETRSRGVGGGGEFAGEEVTGVSEGKQSSERLLGSWAEHGLRVSHAELIGILLRTGFKGTNAVELGNQQATQSHTKATPKPTDSQPIATPKPHQSHTKVRGRRGNVLAEDAAHCVGALRFELGRTIATERAGIQAGLSQLLLAWKSLEMSLPPLRSGESRARELRRQDEP
jgi:hypothetical protein